jgi:hypothetical protein
VIPLARISAIIGASARARASACAAHTRRAAPATVTPIPDEAAAYLFGPLLAAIKTEARTTVSEAQFSIFGKTTFWRFVGLGAFAFGLGTAIGIGFYGYSYVIGNSDNLTVL